MKTIRYIFAIPLGIAFSVLASLIFNFIVPYLNYVNPTIYQYAEWTPNFMAGVVFIISTFYIAPSKRKLFLILSILIGIVTFILNKIYFDTLEFAFIFGIILGTLNIFLSSHDEIK